MVPGPPRAQTNSTGRLKQWWIVVQRSPAKCKLRQVIPKVTCMVIGISQITLHLPTSHSLKDKRQIIKSIMARVRQQFEVAIAEVDEHDRWQIARLGVSCVS